MKLHFFRNYSFLSNLQISFYNQPVLKLDSGFLHLNIETSKLCHGGVFEKRHGPFDEVGRLGDPNYV